MMEHNNLICGTFDPEFAPPRLEFSTILTDDALKTLSEFTMFAENEPLMWAMEAGKPAGGFWSLASEVSTATETAIKQLHSGQARALFLMRAFYLLGVLRGGEAYRNSIINADTEPEFNDIPFELDPLAAADFADDLSSLPPEYFNNLLSVLGLSVPWVADTEKGDTGV